MSRLMLGLLLLIVSCSKSVPVLVISSPPAPAISLVPRFPMAVTCYIGSADSGRSCSSRVDHIGPGVTWWKGDVCCGDTGGKISDIEYEMLRQGDEGDR